MSSSVWTQAPERGSTFATRSMFTALNLLGYHVARVLLLPIVAYFVLTGANSRKASRKYLTRLYLFRKSKKKPNLLNIYQHHFDFALTLLERVLLWQGKADKFRFSGTGKDLIEHRNGRGSLLFGAHFGSFDALRFLAAEMNCPVNVVMYRANAARINRFLENINADTNMRVIELNENDLQGVLKVKDCIERGEHVALLADRAAPGSKEPHSAASFLGNTARFPQGPWLLARTLGCPVIFLAAARSANRTYRIYVEKITDQVERSPEALDQHIQQFAHRLEVLCDQHPTQWFNFYDFWNAP